MQGMHHSLQTGRPNYERTALGKCMHSTFEGKIILLPTVNKSFIMILIWDRCVYRPGMVNMKRSSQGFWWFCTGLGWIAWRVIKPTVFWWLSHFDHTLEECSRKTIFRCVFGFIHWFAKVWFQSEFSGTLQMAEGENRKHVTQREGGYDDKWASNHT